MIVGAAQRRSLYVVTAALWLSGVGFWLLDATARGPQEWRPRLLAIHGGAALFFVAVVGSLWPFHVVRAWRAAANRWSGGAVIAWSVTLTVTGWGLYYSAGEALREWLRDLHFWLGIAVPAVLVLHVALGRLWRGKLLAERAAHLRRSEDQP